MMMLGQSYFGRGLAMAVAVAVCACAPSSFSPPTPPTQDVIGEPKATLKGEDYLPSESARDSIETAFQLAVEGRYTLSRFENLNIKAAKDFMRFSGQKVSADALNELCNSVSRQLQAASQCESQQAAFFIQSASVMLSSLEVAPETTGVYQLQKDALRVLERLGLGDSNKLRAVVDTIQLSSLDVAYLLTLLAKTARSLDFGNTSKYDDVPWD